MLIHLHISIICHNASTFQQRDVTVTLAEKYAKKREKDGSLIMTNGTVIGLVPKNILIVGNGFDIAQGLPTQYTDFLDFLRIQDPVQVYEEAKAGSILHKDLGRFMKCTETVDVEQIKRFVDLRKGNCWAQYYRDCGAEIVGWIDFEREMIPALKYIEWLCAQSPTILNRNQRTSILITTSDQSIYRIARLFPKFATLNGFNSKIYEIELCEEYYSLSYGILRAAILKTLKEDLDNFIEMFRIYLTEIVSNMERKLIPAVFSQHFNALINFNYIQSELFFDNLLEAESFHVHGDTSKEKNMVFGVNELSDEMKNDYLFFTKSFQRIRIKSNPNYRKLLNESFNVTFFGHSLDMTDVGIIKPFYERASHVTVFHYSEEDYEDKVLNLIRMMGIKQIEDDVYSGRLEFKSST